jgi:hypothetical protein
MSINSIEQQDAPDGPWERTLLQAVRALRFGSVEVVVHEGRVVQIETREKVRFADDRRPDDRRRPDPRHAAADRTPGGTAHSIREKKE